MTASAQCTHKHAAINAQVCLQGVFVNLRAQFVTPASGFETPCRRRRKRLASLHCATRVTDVCVRRSYGAIINNGALLLEAPPRARHRQSEQATGARVVGPLRRERARRAHRSPETRRAASRPARASSSRARAAAAAAAMTERERGVVRYISADKQFGFLSRDSRPAGVTVNSVFFRLDDVLPPAATLARKVRGRREGGRAAQRSGAAAASARPHPHAAPSPRRRTP